MTKQKQLPEQISQLPADLQETCQEELDAGFVPADLERTVELYLDRTDVEDNPHPWWMRVDDVVCQLNIDPDDAQHAQAIFEAVCSGAGFVVLVNTYGTHDGIDAWVSFRGDHDAERIASNQ